MPKAIDIQIITIAITEVNSFGKKSVSSEIVGATKPRIKRIVENTFLIFCFIKNSFLIKRY